uniref:Uncharacterized protein n=1 Tax=Strongyloides papillosus TaxID=174720 RepID=A0A0N5B9X2_STREA
MNLQDNSRLLNRRRRYFSESEKGNVNTDEVNVHNGSPSRRFLENVMEKLHIRPRRATTHSVLKTLPNKLVNSLDEDLGFPPEEHESPPNVVVPLHRSLHDVIEEDVNKEKHQTENIKNENANTVATCLIRQNRVIKSQGVFLVFPQNNDQNNTEYFTNSNASSDAQLFKEITNDGDLYISCSNLLSESYNNDSDSNISPGCSPTVNDMSHQTDSLQSQHIPIISTKKRNSLAQKMKATFKGRNRAASLCTSTLQRDFSAERFNNNNNNSNMSEAIQITNNTKKSGSTTGLSHSLKTTNMMYSRPYQKSTEGLPEEISHSPRGKGLLIKEVSFIILMYSRASFFKQNDNNT